MEKNYIFAGIILVVVIAGYFVFFSEKETLLDSGLDEINSFWGSQGLKPVYLVSPLKVYLIEESKLVSIKENLTAFRSELESQEDSEGKEKLLLLAETQLDLIENALLQKKNFALMDYFESVDYNFDVLCSSMNQAETLQKNIVLQNQLAESCNAKINAFSSSYPAEAEKAGINSIKLGVSSKESFADLEPVISALKEVC